MRTLAVGDVHGCSEELANLLHLAAADRVVLVGDLFTKGPDPVGVWNQIREGGFQAVLGNHDARVIDARNSQTNGGARHTVDMLQASDPRVFDWLETLPIFLEVAGFTVVHAGLHPSGDLARTGRKNALNLRRWPNERPSDPLWYEVYAGERRVIYGHDAVNGLVRIERDGLPWIMGLDTGCVYGGKLSGWLIEEDRLLQVPAARVYRPIKLAKPAGL